MRLVWRFVTADDVKTQLGCVRIGLVARESPHPAARRSKFPTSVHATPERANMKRYVVELDCLYAELLSDAAYAYPALRHDFERDLKRLTQLSSSRGLPTYMVDLVKLGKHLDGCLAKGQYVPSGLPASQPIGGGVGIPKLFRGLYLLIFDSDGSLKENVDVQALQFLRQLLLCSKKADVECSAANNDLAIADFVATDTELPPPPACWAAPSYEGLQAEHKGFIADVNIRERVCAAFGKGRGLNILTQLDRICSAVTLSLGVYDPLDWRFRHGPGATSDCSQGDNRYRLRPWSPQLEDAFPYADVCFYNYCSWADETRMESARRILFGEARLQAEPVSHLSAVPKTLTKPRLIASEPVSHMWCQQNLRDYMYSRVKDNWLDLFVDFRDQSFNQYLARLGSWDGSLVTIDLSAASDRVSCQVVGNVFRANLRLLHALASSRTRSCLLPGGQVLALRKYSTMGNATTFPVQSLIFLCVALTCQTEGTRVSVDQLRACSGLVSVFGDDIIVTKEKSADVILLLEALGFKVNTDKCFTVGNFRESCGVDAFRGVDVTPAYWHGPTDDECPESIASSVEVANNLYKRFLVNASAFIERGLGRIRIHRRPYATGPLGFDCFCDPPICARRRWNDELQREEFRLNVVETVGSKRRQVDDTSLLQYFSERPVQWVKWEHGISAKPQVKIRKRWVSAAQLSKL